MTQALCHFCHKPVTNKESHGWNNVKRYWYHPECERAYKGKKLGLNKKEKK
jgi:hypothetical protein